MIIPALLAGSLAILAGDLVLNVEPYTNLLTFELVSQQLANSLDQSALR